MRPKVQLLAHDLKFQRQERAKLNQMRRQVLIPREKIPSLSSSNLQPLFFFHQRILHNKRVIIRLLFQATKGHHISLSFPKRICYSKTTPFGLEKGIYFYFFILPFFIFFLSDLHHHCCSSRRHRCHTSINCRCSSKIVGPLPKIVALSSKTIVFVSVITPRFHS